MANINAIISLGIGTPGDIPHFILTGLNINLMAAAVPRTLDLGECHIQCRQSFLVYCQPSVEADAFIQRRLTQRVKAG